MFVPELPVPEEVKEAAIDYVDRYFACFAERDTFNGTKLQKIMGHIGQLMLASYLVFAPDEMATINRDRRPDKYDFKHNGFTYDAKTSWSRTYQNDDVLPDTWGLLIPESQFLDQPKDFYVRCVVNGQLPSQITKCAFLCACDKEMVSKAPIKMWNMPRVNQCVTMRVVPRHWCFGVDKLKARPEL